MRLIGGPMGDPVRDGFIAAAEVARRKFEECKAPSCVASSQAPAKVMRDLSSAAETARN